MGGGDQRMGGWADVRRRGPRTCSANGNRIKVGVTHKTPNPLFLIWSTKSTQSPSVEIRNGLCFSGECTARKSLAALPMFP